MVGLHELDGKNSAGLLKNTQTDLFQTSQKKSGTVKREKSNRIMCCCITLNADGSFQPFASGGLTKLTSNTIVPNITGSISKAACLSESIRVWRGFEEEIKGRPSDDLVVRRRYNVDLRYYWLVHSHMCLKQAE